ncbi:protein kinase with WD40 repeat at C-terminus [Cryptosporidium ryanae]|uniref:protein kinase with WD40 repeat at C-terminus n=1 Tax=Cryptosporidium ryanae TaxID=515981 RepID=UPI003519F5DD|nr:protein kinase with WD40 repeat at C-terminus [Cryptosporidium ryanae]
MDIFSLGCILKEINDGNPPFTINEILRVSEDKFNISKSWRDMLVCRDWNKRPNILDLFLLLSGIERRNFDVIYLYSICYSISQNAEFDRSFYIFFYPLSIILQSDIFNDIRVQLIILNMAFPTLLELFVIEDIELDTDCSCDFDFDNYIKLYSNIFSTVKVNYKSSWDGDKLKKTFQTVFDFDLRRDLIFLIMISNFNNSVKDNSFDKCSFDNDSIDESHLNVKGLFSLFQLLLNHWEANNDDRTDEKNKYEMNKIFTKIIIENAYYLGDSKDSFEINKQNFIEFINNEHSNNSSQSIILFTIMIINCMEKMNNYHINNEFVVNDNEIINSINLMSINTLKLLLDLLPHNYKELLLTDKILPFFFQYLSLNILNANDYISQKLNDLTVESQDMVVISEMFNFIKDFYVFNNTEIAENDNSKHTLIRTFIVNNIENWIKHYILLNSSEVVVVLLRMFRKIMNLVLKSKKNDYKLSDWVLGILISDNSTMKFILIEEDDNGSSLLLDIVLFHIEGRKDILISEILPHLVNQLNDSDNNVRSGYCKLVTLLLLENIDTLILPYGRFCIEKSLNDRDFKVQCVAIECINIIVERLNKYMNLRAYSGLYEVIVSDLVELVTNNIDYINQIQIYLPLIREFGRLIYNLIEISSLMNNWLVIYSLLEAYFKTDNLTIKNLLQLKNLNLKLGLNKFEVIVYFFTKFLKNRHLYIRKANYFDYISRGSNITSLVKYNILSSYLNVNQMLLCFPTKMNVFNRKISDHISSIQLESKLRLRKKIIDDKCFTARDSRFKFFIGSITGNIVTKKPIVKGNYLGSIYCHQNLTDGQCYNVFQDTICYNKDVYSWSLNSSLNTGVYLHKLNAEVNNKYHCWNLMTNGDDNHIFKFKNNCSITTMCVLYDDLAIITGDNNGLLTKLKLNPYGYNHIISREYPYSYEKKLFNFKNSIKEKPSVVLIGKVLFNSRQMIMSIYSNGDIYIFDPNYISIDFFFTVPPYLGIVIDYCVDGNLSDTSWLCLLTDSNILIIVNLTYLKETKIWEIQSKSGIMKVRTLKQSIESTKVVLFINDSFSFEIFDWNTGELGVSSMFGAKEIKGNLLVYSPRLYKKGILHKISSHPDEVECCCTLCECQRIRIFRNYMMQYSHISTKYKGHCNNHHLIGPIISQFADHSERRDSNINSLYIFNDNMGNIHQKKLVLEENCYDFDDPPICIIENKDKKNIINNYDCSHQIHKDILTSLSVYSFHDCNFGIFTSSRDGIVSYWN